MARKTYTDEPEYDVENPNDPNRPDRMPMEDYEAMGPQGEALDVMNGQQYRRKDLTAPQPETSDSSGSSED